MGVHGVLHRRQGPTAEAAPARLSEDCVCEDNPARAVDVLIDELDLSAIGFPLSLRLVAEILLERGIIVP